VPPQLTEVTGEPLPVALTGVPPWEWFPLLLEKAARRCTRNGERLVLVVDGLNGDRGVTGGGDGL